MPQQIHHSLAGEGRELFTVDSTATVKVGAEHTDGEYELFEIDGERGAFVPPHRHPWPESYYVLHGRMSVQVGSKRYEMGPGESITVPTGAVHTIEVRSKAVKFLAFSLTDGTGKLFADLDANVPPGRPMEELAPLVTEIAERNRTSFIGRPAQ
ncbi:cupin domain-containing protein [Microbispora sp. NPDC046933]|uniref:cupin domain-containing protein n=1 Tax=Microbispora sp. NPDC046933 TaxID=3155618 RepID=UPI0033C8970D